MVYQLCTIDCLSNMVGRLREKLPAFYMSSTVQSLFHAEIAYADIDVFFCRVKRYTDVGVDAPWKLLSSLLVLLAFKGSRPEWCISSMIYSRDTPFWLGTVDIPTFSTLVSERMQGKLFWE